MIFEIAVGVSTVLVTIYFYLTRNYDYWKKRGVPSIYPRFPFGTAQPLVNGKQDIGTVYRKWYTEYKKQGTKFVGSCLVTQPTLIVLDLDLCKQVLTKDFDHFTSRDFAISKEHISKHLFALEGQEWREMRTKLTPTFTSGKMKNMYSLMWKCGEQLQKYIDDVVLKTGEFEAKDLIARFTTDIIATCAFGLEVNCIEDKDNEFYKIGQLIFLPKRANLLRFLLIKNYPNVSGILNISLFDPRISPFLTKVVKDTIEHRKLNNIVRNDFIDLLLKVKERHSLEDHNHHEIQDTTKTNGKREPVFKETKQDTQHEMNALTLEQMVAQSFVFFAAGFETAASTTSFCLYELAMNTDVQERLRAEIDEVMARHEGKITYQALQEMVYMDQVLNETLRRYASLPIISRVCTERYQFPGTDLIIDKGVRVNIPTYAIHHDPDIYPDPFRFDPDRFSEENSRGRHHYAFLPFGEGPRMCIGMRFGRLQVKVGLATILSRYQLSPASNTPSRIELNPLIFITTPKNPLSLRISRRTDISN